MVVVKYRHYQLKTLAFPTFAAHCLWISLSYVLHIMSMQRDSVSL
jgi:hypothetical protein